MERMKHILLRNRRQKKLVKKGFKPDVRIGYKKDCYILNNTLETLAFISKNQEVLEDVFGKSIYNIQKVKRRFFDDQYYLHLKDYPVYENYIFKKIIKDTRFNGLDYSENELHEYFEENPVELIVGSTGSGKTKTILTKIKYHELMLAKYYPGHQLVKIIIDPKGSDFLSLVKSSDHFFRLDLKSEYELLLSILKVVDQECKKANRESLETKTKYIIVIDEILNKFNKAKENDKEIQRLKDEIIFLLEIIMTQHCRLQKVLLIGATQSFSINDSAIPLVRFTDKLVSKPTQPAYADSIGSKLILRNDLKKGRWVVLSKNIVTQMPKDLSDKYDKRKNKNPISNIFVDFLKSSFKSYFKKRNQKKYKVYIQKNYERWSKYMLGKDYQNFKLHKYKNKYENQLCLRHHFLTMRIMRKAYINGE